MGKETDPKIKAFTLLTNILNEGTKDLLSPGDILSRSMGTLQKIFGFSPEEASKIYTQFLAAEISSSMSGGFTELPDINNLPEGSWVRKRVASFVWWYTQFRVDSSGVMKSLEPEKRMRHAYMRAHFDLGNNDKDTVTLLRWADANPEKIAVLFAQAIGTKELELNQVSTLAKFCDKAADGTLNPLHFPTD